MEAEEGLREASALGNLKVVQQHIYNGVNVNSINKMNKWTALHWAASRGHKSIVQTLLDCGADPTLEDNQGRTPAQVAKGEACQLFGVEEKLQKQDLGFVPNYLATQDPNQLWNAPKDETDLPKKTKETDEPSPKSVTSVKSAPKTLEVRSLVELREILVFRERVSTETILGAIFAPNQTLLELKEQIETELDIKVTRMRRKNNLYEIPIHPNQYQQRAFQHLGSCNIIIVL
ncbi:ankyrin repeat-containing domain protein [Gorgonomyces haynaldii]|nr:ankyrin repeat-containing domain protein [Gorgonomyces haynaldii]